MADSPSFTNEELDAIPEDALLAEIYVVQDRSGVIPPKVLVAEVRAEPPKLGNYYLNAKLIKLDVPSILKLLSGEACEWKTVQCQSISPRDLLRLKVGEGSRMSLPGKAGAELMALCPDGIDVFHGLCIADAKETLVDRLVGRALEVSEKELTRLQARFAGLQALRSALDTERSNGNEANVNVNRTSDGVSPR